MRVGPASAGSEPGPVCYQRGGTEPTVTDASVVLGYLNPEAFAGGDFYLDVDAAHRALEGIGASLGMSVVEAALGAHRIMNVQMAEQIRLITVKRGYDPRRFTLIAFGGAGPLHAGVLMSMLGMKECLIPATPGVLSAYGLLNADIEVEHSESFLKRADAIGASDLTVAFNALEAHCREIMRRDGLALGGVRARYSADMRYTGQSYEIPIALGNTSVTVDTVTQMVADFEQQYQKMYGHTNRTQVEIVNLRCVTYEPVEPLEGMHIQTRGKHSGGVRSHRRVHFLGGELLTAVLNREDLASGDRIAGPAVIEQADTTILIYPQQTAVVDDQSNLRITGVSEAYVL
jgi:N-methylhydantoinase A